jgi:hypothetical protein
MRRPAIRSTSLAIVASNEQWSPILLRDAAQADLTVAGGRQHDVMGLNACELFELSAWRVTEACPALPHLQGLPQHEGQKAHEDVGLDAVGTLVPDRVYLEPILLDAKGRFGSRELDWPCVFSAKFL